MYNPQEVEEDTTEFIELYNHDTTTVNLSEWKITKGVEYTFPNDSRLNQGEYLVIADDTIAIKNYYGPVAILHQWDRGSLKNSGEAIVLTDARNNTIDSVNYSDSGAWPTLPDGNGPSLELASPFLDNSISYAWLTCISKAGTPGQPNSVYIPMSNYPPTTVKLIQPDNDTVGTVIEFNWRSSFDYDLDELYYNLTIFGADLDTIITGLIDTTFNFDITGEDYLEKTKANWSVSVSDSIFTVQCDEPYSFITPRIIGILDKNQLAYQFKLFQNLSHSIPPDDNRQFVFCLPVLLLHVH